LFAESLLLSHPVTAVFGVAIFVRVCLAVVINIHSGGSLFGDDQTYSQMAFQYAAGNTSQWSAYEHELLRTNATFLYPFIALYDVFGPHIILGQLLVALMGAAAAAVTTRLALEGLRTRWALFAGLVVALLPSQVLWSALTLKDAFLWALLAGVGLCAAVAMRSSGRKVLFLFLGIVVLLVLMAYLRRHTFLVAAWALALTSWLGTREGRMRRTVGSLLIALCLPWIFGIGIGGEALVAQNAGGLPEQRSRSAANAATALVQPPPQPGPTQAPAPAPAPSSTPSAGQPSQPASIDDSLGHESVTGNVKGNARYLPRGLAAMVLLPYPWQSTPSHAMALAKLETVVWYPLLLLALLGVFSLRRNSRVLGYAVVVGAAIATMWALVEGNFGTAYRHRGEFVWVVALLAAFGAQRLADVILTRRASRIAGTTPPFG
jgi:hypothetical protein